MGGRHQIRFRRQFVGGMSPIGIGKRTQLAAVDEGFQALLNTFKIRASPLGSVADIVRQCCGLFGIGFKRTDNIHPIQRMQMIKMNNMIMLKLGAHQKVADNSCVFGYLHANCVIDCPHRGHSMGVRSDAAGELYKMMGIPWIASLKDQLDPS